MEISQEAPAARAGGSLEALVAALAEAIPVFVTRLREPSPAQPAARAGTSPPNRDYFCCTQRDPL